jgi:hypothetical protein
MKRLVTTFLLLLITGTSAGLTPPGTLRAAATPTAHPHTSHLCPGAEQMTIVNNSGFPDNRVYGAVTWNHLTIGVVSPSDLVDQSLSLQDNYRSTGALHTFYFCLQSGAGRFWLSLGSPINSDLATGAQPSPATAPYRFGIVEFAYPSSSASLDSSNVNNFDFPIDLQTYGTPGGSAAAQSAVFKGNTCQIVNTMKDAVAGSRGAADLSQIELNENGQFVRIIAPDTRATGWPDMEDYIGALASSLPTVTSGPFAGETGPIVINDFYGGDPGTGANRGWFKAEGFFDSSGDLTIDAGTHIAGIGAGASSANGPYPNALPDDITVSEAHLASGVHQQGFTYGVGDGNDIYAWMWGDVTSGFDYGYWGSAYGNDSIGFSSPTGRGALAGNGQPAFVPQRTIAYPSAPGGLGYNLYAAVLEQYSPSYTFPYNERWGRGGFGTSPLLHMPAAGEVRITIPPDGWSGGSGSTRCVTGPPPNPGTGHGGRTGYREVASDGGIFTFGGASYDGSMGGRPLNAPIVGMAATPKGNGYWEVASDGGIFSFGDADFHGSTGGQPLNAPIVGMTPTADGGGYWEVASDGGVFAFGDARFYGSMGGQHLAEPIVGVAATPDSLGYWLVAADGGVFAFGDARFYGSMGGQHLNGEVVAIAASGDGAGYWEVASDGGLFTFGDATYLGSMGGQHLNDPIVGIG